MDLFLRFCLLAKWRNKVGNECHTHVFAARASCVTTRRQLLGWLTEDTRISGHVAISEDNCDMPFLYTYMLVRSFVLSIYTTTQPSHARSRQLFI